ANAELERQLQEGASICAVCGHPVHDRSRLVAHRRAVAPLHCLDERLRKGHHARPGPTDRSRSVVWSRRPAPRLDVHLLELRRSFGAIRGTEFRSSVSQVAGDRVRTQAETLSDLLIRLTLRGK